MLPSYVFQLLQGSHETIDVSFIVEAPSLTKKATAEAEARELQGNSDVSKIPDGGKLHEEGITYAQMQVLEHHKRLDKFCFLINKMNDSK